MTSVVARSMPIHNMHGVTTYPETFSHLDHIRSSESHHGYFEYAKCLTENRLFSDTAGNFPGNCPVSEGSGKMLEIGGTSGGKRKGSSEESGAPQLVSAVKLRDELTAPPDAKYTRLQIEITGIGRLVLFAPVMYVVSGVTCWTQLPLFQSCVLWCWHLQSHTSVQACMFEEESSLDLMSIRTFCSLLILCFVSRIVPVSMQVCATNFTL